MAKNTLVNSAVNLVRALLPADHYSPLDRLNDWAAERVRTRLLESAGLGRVQSEMFSFMYEFDSFVDAWDLINRMSPITGQAGLCAEAQQQVKLALSESLAAYRQPGGAYSIPHACRLSWGQR